MLEAIVAFYGEVLEPADVPSRTEKPQLVGSVHRRLAAELAMRARRPHLRIDGTGAALVVVGPSGRLIDANRAAGAAVRDGAVSVDSRGVVHVAGRHVLDAGEALFVPATRARRRSWHVLVARSLDAATSYVIAVPATVVLSRLSRRQREVAERIVRGATIVETARDLRIAAETVRSHLREVYRKLGVSNRAELAVTQRDLCPS